jgi:hypothetical protein
MVATESIIDASRPSAGRIYDYLLGGHHNFEVDRQAADQLVKLVPFVSKLSRLQRWCLQDVARELTEVRGYDLIIDFASGLPTNDHIHMVAPKGTTVIYSDYDPVVVEYAHDILKDTPNVHFFQADARHPEEFLSRPEVKAIIGDRRDVAVVYWGIGMFVGDEDLSHAARALYDWSGPRSCWALNAQWAELEEPNLQDPTVARVLKIYESTGQPLTPRSMTRYRNLTQPWKPDPGGFVSFFDWHGLDPSIMDGEDRRLWGPAGSNYGVYLVK